MNSLISQPTHPRRLWARLAVAFTAASAVTLAGLPGLHTDEAEAKPRTQRCDEKYLGQKFDRTPANSGPPDNLEYDPWPNDETYTYDNPAKAYDGVLPPTEKQLEKAGTDYRKWQRIANKSGKPADRVMEIYARFQEQRDRGGYTDFKRYLDVKYIGKPGNNYRGEAFMARMVKKYNMIGPDWWCEDPVDYTDEDGKKKRRWVDARNRRTNVHVEGKSNGEVKQGQIDADRQIAKQNEKVTNRYLTGARTDQGTKDRVSQLNKDVQQYRGTTRTVAGINERRSNAIERTRNPNNYTRYDPRFNPDPRKNGMRGPIIDQALRSGKSLEEAQKLQRIYNNNNSRGYFMRGPGGIDFSSLELSYVGAPVKGKGFNYSMKADYAKNPDTNPGYGGDAKLTMSSDAMFTWLALTPDKFWVNLNPDQPETIMDSKFASTDAGRVLLEADLRLKHDFFKAMDPKTDTGKAAWDGLVKRNGWPCLNSGRNWIEPKTAKVREQDGGVYILDAPLKLKSEYMDINTPGPGGGRSCAEDLTKAEIEHNERVLNNTVVPLVEKWINTEPQYADLRRVYNARVAAEYIRRKDAASPTDFHGIIDSNDVKRWPLRAPNQDWDKQQVFDKYRKIFTEGEFKYELTKGQEVWVITVGGVDFSKAPRRNINRSQFNLEHRGLDKTTKTSTGAETTYQDTETAYLGGTSGKLPDGDDPNPTPTPAPTDKPTDKPTDQPTTPAPDPSTPGGGDASQPPATKDPDGNLAGTGSNTPVGLIAGIAAALAAAGGTLVWWMRRRRSTEDN
ncbi:hypothetical protein GTZ78_43660 [Streptomyces sp. SID8361]|uniref:hypothetical protein n=1 Tax=Streptomyces sp. MnatMP-M27 TaxID=1839768 RepID=UPI00081E113E|nr:hypothetical protein [Streptomyces sp. MnatMP-M27]MYU17406.1 hypothetical protein [Streptomyces sp. SID8361]SCG11961.1 hypothetical protein GA0115260_115978 [Streptomyces sp. MnatMP-M27]